MACGSSCMVVCGPAVIMHDGVWLIMFCLHHAHYVRSLIHHAHYVGSLLHHAYYVRSLLHHAHYVGSLLHHAHYVGLLLLHAHYVRSISVPRTLKRMLPGVRSVSVECRSGGACSSDQAEAAEQEGDVQGGPGAEADGRGEEAAGRGRGGGVHQSATTFRTFRRTFRNFQAPEPVPDVA